LFFVGVFIGNNSSVERYYQNKANEFLSDELSKFEEIQTLVVNDPSLKQSIAKLDAKLLPTQLLANYQLSLFVYNKNNCVLWTDNQTLHHHFGINKHANTYQIQNQNGWYQIVAKKIDSFDVYCYFNYYRKYPIASEFFKSGFHSSLNLGTIQLIDSELKNLNEGNISQSETLPEVENTGFSASKINRLQLFLLFFSVLFFLIYIIWGISSSTIPLNTSLLYIMWFLTISSSFILFDFYFINLEAFTLFSPELAAYSHMVPSFGHGLLLAFVVLFICGLAYWYSQNNWKIKVKSIYLYSLIIALKSFFWLYIVLVILPDFVNNSYVNYDFKDVSNLSVFSFFGFLNVFLLVAVWIILNRIFRNVLIFSVVEFKKNWKLNGLIYLFNVLMFRFIQGENLFLLISCLVFLFIVDWFVFKPVRLRINHLFWVFSLSAGLLSVQLEQLNSHKEKEQRKIFANKIISNQDDV
jgi:hypothetical protein